MIAAIARRLGLGASATARADAANSGWMLGERALRLILGVVVTAYVARHLGPGDFGALAYALSLTSILVPVANFGLNAVVVRALVAKEASEAEVMGAALAVNLAGCALAGLGYVAIRAFAGLEGAEAQVFAITGVALFFALSPPAEALLQARRTTRPAAIAVMAGRLVAAAARVGLVLAGAGVVAFGWVYLLEQALMLAGFVFGYARVAGLRTPLRFSLPVIRRIAKSAAPLLLASAAVLLFMRIDQVMIRRLMDVEAVGVYAAAVRISEAWYFIPHMLTMALFPTILEARARSEAAFRARMRVLFLLTVGLGWVVLAGVALFGGVAIRLLFGEAYAGAAPVLTIHAAGGIFVAAGVASSRWYIAHGWERRMFARVVLGLAVNIALNLALIPQFGLVGAAWATVAGYAAGYWLYDALSPRTRLLFRDKTAALAVLPAFAALRRAPDI